MFFTTNENKYMSEIALGSEADYGLTDMAFSGTEGFAGADVNPKDYEGLLVKFVADKWLNTAKSKEEGRPIYDLIPYISIRTPGDRVNEQYRPATELDQRRWPKHWEAFQAKAELREIGTPLEEWPQLNAAQIAELKHFNIETVENLAAVNDNVCQRFMGLTTLRTQAQAYLEAADSNASAQRIVDLEAQNQTLLERLAAMEARLEELDPNEE